MTKVSVILPIYNAEYNAEIRVENTMLWINEPLYKKKIVIN